LGAVGQALRQSFPECVLWGCEINSSAAQIACEHFDYVINRNIEELSWDEDFKSRSFDLVCLLDVLEHLVNPWKVLKGLKEVISQDAHLLVSLPNVSNLFLLQDAFRGHWRYRRMGLLDFTHLRFFTDYDARKMFYQTGYRVLDHRKIYLGAGQETLRQYRGGCFPIILSLSGLSVDVNSLSDLERLCADQNLYLLTPHHGEFEDAEEHAMVSDEYPLTQSFGGD
jgi:SAM-dependent methyltransferase